MTSNVIALRGVGFGPQVPPRPAAPSAEQIRPAAESRAGDRGATAPQNGAANQAESQNSAAARPHSPVNLNSLLAAQEHSGAQGRAGAPAPGPAQAANQSAQLSEGEREQVKELKKQDAEIRRHEQAHAAAGGQYAGAPQYGYTNGPDGQRYANSGHVTIDVTPVAGDPKGTIEKMTVVQRAANAPAEPSGADRSVAARAAATKQTAQVELAKLKAQESAEPTDENSPEADAATGFVAGFTVDSERPKDKPATATPGATAGVSHAAAAAAYAAPLNAIAGASTI
ncbi:MAG: hypothetical protein ISR50_09310 [Alphaproteobacteria bacterium]|nr:hypothetical protein [Alphaproteobacteria bacterium]